MLIHNPTTDTILSNILERPNHQDHGYLILIGEENNIDFKSLIETLNQNQIDFCGAIFPGIIYGAKQYPDKALVIPMEFAEKPTLVKGLNNGEIEIPEIAPQLEEGTLLVLLDGLSSWISRFLFKLYERSGSRLSVFGSGAGIDSFDRIDNIFSPDGLFRDVAILIPLKKKISQSIKHGWSNVSGPYIASKTEANLIQEIDWQPAFNVYKNILKQEEGQHMTPKNFYEIAKHYPFGIHRTDGENLIRDPVKIEENGALRFVAEVPNNTVLFLMKSDIESMLKVGVDICNEVFDQCKDPEYVFVVDCVSRTKILLNKFDEELESIDSIARNYEIPVIGVLSMGEISSANHGILEYHNKSIVISTLEPYV